MLKCYKIFLYLIKINGRLQIKVIFTSLANFAEGTRNLEGSWF